jgi:hypothetical protein
MAAATAYPSAPAVFAPVARHRPPLRWARHRPPRLRRRPPPRRRSSRCPSARRPPNRPAHRRCRCRRHRRRRRSPSPSERACPPTTMPRSPRRPVRTPGPHRLAVPSRHRRAHRLPHRQPHRRRPPMAQRPAVPWIRETRRQPATGVGANRPRPTRPAAPTCLLRLHLRPARRLLLRRGKADLPPRRPRRPPNLRPGPPCRLLRLRLHRAPDAAWSPPRGLAPARVIDSQTCYGFVSVR